MVSSHRGKRAVPSRDAERFPDAGVAASGRDALPGEDLDLQHRQGCVSADCDAGTPQSIPLPPTHLQTPTESQQAPKKLKPPGRDCCRLVPAAPGAWTKLHVPLSSCYAVPLVVSVRLRGTGVVGESCLQPRLMELLLHRSCQKQPPISSHCRADAEPSSEPRELPKR